MVSIFPAMYDCVTLKYCSSIHYCYFMYDDDDDELFLWYG